jgi:hypothetical protein
MQILNSKCQIPNSKSQKSKKTMVIEIRNLLEPGICDLEFPFGACDLRFGIYSLEPGT